MEKSKQNESKLENEKRHLLDEISRYESRSNKLDLQRIALEGDIQRLQMTLQVSICISIFNCFNSNDGLHHNSLPIKKKDNLRTFASCH